MLVSEIRLGLEVKPYAIGLTCKGSLAIALAEQKGLRPFRLDSDLKKWGINVQMETKDSVVFKLFFRLPSSPADTSRIKDSLSLLYGTMGKTSIEQ